VSVETRRRNRLHRVVRRGADGDGGHGPGRPVQGLAPAGNYRVSARVPTEPDLVPRLTTVTVESDRYVRVEVVIGTRLNEP